MEEQKPLRAPIPPLFWSSEEHRLRSPWRLLLFLLLLMISTLGIAIVAVVLIPQAREMVFWFTAGGAVVSLVATAGSIWLAALFLDRRPVADYGLHTHRNWWLDLGFGLLLGALLMSGIFLVEWLNGWVTITGVFHAPGDLPFALDILNPLIMLVSVGIYEEILFRGYILRNLAEGLRGLTGRLAPSSPPWLPLLVAWLVSSALFGFAHILNPNATLISTLNITLAGLFLGAGYVLTGDLAIPIGLHITWNFFQGIVFGFPVSGMDLPLARVMTISQEGPEHWTGGKFGPEAGWSGFIAMVVGSLLIVLWVRFRSGSVALRSSLADYTTHPTTEPESGR